MIDFKDISVHQLMYFSEIIRESSLFRQEFIQEKYSRVMPHYETTIEFFKTLKLITIEGPDIVIKPEYKKIIQEAQMVGQPQQVFGKHIVKLIFSRPSEIREDINQFLCKFSLRGENYDFKPTLKQKIQYAGVRNFLMELHLIDYDDKESRYALEEWFVLEYPDLNEGNFISEKSFKAIQILKGKIGRAAEKAVLKYEINRLSDFPNIIDKIEHVAIKNVSAGYDIKSFDHGEHGGFTPRLIEVKAVSNWDYRFYWTKNEIETSRRHRSNYYLYLLPVLTKNDFDIEGMKIINDPFMNIFSDQSMWYSTVETISYALRTDAKTTGGYSEA